MQYPTTVGDRLHYVLDEKRAIKTTQMIVLEQRNETGTY
jgi:hypothetical protein